ncbi:probable methyltransferase-like protein 25 isoform X2 [Neodiprion virginianus]|uniref:probable methyltransferase-like protein 25 isoform X2 n=1 Tax=Neodiprion virginianus TaxID=2961670 RepID=UPI001EE6C3A2|nr:probable methyltransferase-like protein 25 isoform X2 [Neodiprion virginianus]
MSLFSEHLEKESTTPELYKFCKLINALSLDKCNLVYDLRDIPDLFLEWGIDLKNLESKIHNSRLDFMNAKKSYEVEIVARITSSLAEIHSSAVIDAGAGKGYLSQHISEKYKIPVLAIDSSDIAYRGAIRRQNILQKKPNQSSHLVHHLAQRIDEFTEFAELAEKYFPTWSLSENLTLTGLHTCGSLGHSVIKAFLKTDCIKSLCLVTCCYHLAETSLGGKLNISKNAKMLAQQSVQRSCQNEYSLSPTLHYRAVFQVLLHSLGMQDVKVGRGAPVDNFVTYAKWALNKIGLDPTQIPPDNVIEELYSSHESFKAKMELFQTLRIQLGSVIESAILLDRIIYLEDSKVCSNFALVRLFDPLISPRCYGIIAIK